MQFREDKIGGNSLSALGFGCMRFPRARGTAIDMVKTEELILKAIEGGINYFDTAYIYPGSEEALGQILHKHNVRNKVYIADKLPLFLIKNEPDFDKYFNIMLQRLKTDYIDYLLMHMLTDLPQWEKLCSWGIKEWLEDKKKSGKIKHIGFSFHGSKDQFLKILDAYNWEFCQIQYNYSNENYQAGVEGLKKAAEKNIPVIIMEPLLGGRLVTGLSKEARSLFAEANPSLSAAAWALRWLWNQSEVTVILSGMNSMEQLLDNLKAANESSPNMLTESEIEVFRQVKAIFDAEYKVKCTGCGYCMPCPHNVNIPGCFAAYNTSFSGGYKAGIHQYMQSTGAFGQPSGASLCQKCGKCQKHCPQNINIIESLLAVKSKMEPLWYRLVIKTVRFILKKNQ